MYRWIPLVISLTLMAACGDDAESTSDAGTDGSELGDVSCPRDPAVCGNGILEPGESCDDGNTDPGDGCDATCTDMPDTLPDPACDLTGHWMAQKVTVSVAPSLDVQGTTKNHFYYHIVQDGEQFEVVDSLHCGLFVEAPVLDVNMSPRTREALRCTNDSDGRSGTYAPVEGTEECALAFDTYFVVRGLSPKEHWTADDWGLGPEPLTGEGEPTLDGPANPECTCNSESCDCNDEGRWDPEMETPGWADWDQDGEPGITLRPGRSKWFLAMRDWDRYVGTTPRAAAGSPLDQFEVGVEWNNVQQILATTTGALTSEEQPDTSAEHYVAFRRMDSAPDREATSDAELCDRVLETSFE